jgi:Transposase, Mutator family
VRVSRLGIAGLPLADTDPPRRADDIATVAAPRGSGDPVPRALSHAARRALANAGLIAYTENLTPHQAWLNACEHVIPFLAFPDEVRRVIYTTNAIEALNRQLCKAIKTKGSFPNEDAARKLVSTSPCRTRSRDGPGPGTGPRRCSGSRSTSVTASLTLQTDCHQLTLTESLLH